MSNDFEWLDWLEPSGPFLAAPVLNREFPQGLPELDPNKRKMLRQAYDEYRQALDDEDPESSKFHTAWIELVLRKGLEFDEDESSDNLKSADDLPDSLVSQVAEHGVTLKPDFSVVDDQEADKPMMLVQVYGQDVDLNDAVRGDGWACSPKERMVRLCRDTGTRLGLVTNGEHWLFVDAPVGPVSSFGNWYARLWGPEPILLQAFVVLLGIRRFFLAKEGQLPALIDKSVEFQDEVTEALGEQVRRAVEVLIQALDKANVDRNYELLRGIEERELYEAALTVMMRLVFLLSAEERDLLLLGDERYEANYAVSTLRMQLRGEDDAILQRRWDAWSRLLAIFRAIYGGIEHETLRMPALGGSLFDPDRFPFLEGRDKDSSWMTDPAKPLPIDNQTVLLLLDAIQLFEGRTLSYRGLDIEQLGYVYEGLLDHTVKRANEVTLELDATKSAKQPWVTLGELESARLDGEKAVEKLLKERTGSSISRVFNDLKKEVKPQQSMSLLTACHNDQALHDQLKQFVHLIRTDSWGRPLVYPKGSFMVTTGEDRRQTGSHYTPTSLTEAIVKETLEPVVYAGPAEGKPREEWQLKSPEELLDLKICDPAMGSGAFLVQACRWLGDRLAESWAAVETFGGIIDVDGNVHADQGDYEPLASDSDERTILARRLIAERCIYGVDINPLAVELAKLSIWLVTLSKGRPFGYLDHNLRSGDSLLGIHRLDDLINLSPVRGGARQERLFGQDIRSVVAVARNLRSELRRTKIRDIRDVQDMAALDVQASNSLLLSEQIADAYIGSLLGVEKTKEREAQIDNIALMAELSIHGDAEAQEVLVEIANKGLAEDSPNGQPRRPFHWPLEFPELFESINGGFDAVVGNPPFMRGHDISRSFGKKYREYLANEIIHGSAGIADLCAFFIRRAASLLCCDAAAGLVATNSISEGDSRRIGLDDLIQQGAKLIYALPNMKWPGKASVIVSPFVVRKGQWDGLCNLDGKKINHINSSLSAGKNLTPHRLKANERTCFGGSYVLGDGFILTADEAVTFLENEPRADEVILPYINGVELNSLPMSMPVRWIICFWDWPENKASTVADVFHRIEHEVKTERASVARERYRKLWWLHAENRPGFYHEIGLGDRFCRHPKGWSSSKTRQERVLAKAKTSETWAFAFCPSEMIFDQAVTVIASDSFEIFATVQSFVHECWARGSGAGSKMKTDLRYSPAAFETFPFPTKISDRLAAVGEDFYCLRESVMNDRQIGLTRLWNLMNDQSDKSSDVAQVRDLYVSLDNEVVANYGWTDIDLNHGFFTTPKGVRFRACPDAQIELLDRLLKLNDRLYKEELSGSSGSNRTDGEANEAQTGRAAKGETQQHMDFGESASVRAKSPVSGIAKK